MYEAGKTKQIGRRARLPLVIASIAALILSVAATGPEAIAQTSTEAIQPSGTVGDEGNVTPSDPDTNHHKWWQPLRLRGRTRESKWPRAELLGVTLGKRPKVEHTHPVFSDEGTGSMGQRETNRLATIRHGVSTGYGTETYGRRR